MSNLKILVVDDDLITRKIIETTLTSGGYQIILATNGSEAIEMLSNENIDLVITDLQMGDPDGFAVLRKVQDLNPLTKGIVITGNQDVSSAIKAIKIGVEGYLLKPFSSSELLECVEKSAAKVEPYQKVVPKVAETFPSEEQIRVMMQMLSYDVSSALVSASTNFELFKKEEYVEIPKEIVDKWEMLSSRCGKITTMVEEYFDKIYSPKRKVNVGKQELNLIDEIITPVLGDLRVDIEEGNNAIDSPAENSLERITINGDRTQLKEVFRNLFKNTFKYGGKRFTLADHLEYQQRVASCNNELDIPECKCRWVDAAPHYIFTSNNDNTIM